MTGESTPWPSVAELLKALQAEGGWIDEEVVDLSVVPDDADEAGMRQHLRDLGPDVTGWVAWASGPVLVDSQEAFLREGEILLAAELAAGAASLHVQGLGHGRYRLTRLEEGVGEPHLRERVTLLGEAPAARLDYARYWRLEAGGLCRPTAARLVAVETRPEGGNA